MWVLNLEIEKVKLSLRNLQDSLHPDQSMSKALFSMGIRMYADEKNKWTKKSCKNKPDHYMDLTFNVRHISTLILSLHGIFGL